MENTGMNGIPRVALLIPCYNESMTIKKVISDFRAELPDADIYVYDNNSTDDTYQISVDCGAIVKKELKQGKGNVIRSMFRDIDADIYLLVDGDDTYPADACHELIKIVDAGQADMAVGDRLSNGSYVSENKRSFHNFGNNLVKSAINLLFHARLNDVMSGYRCFNRKFVKVTPILSSGFEIETELTLHALDKRFNVKETPVLYRDRPDGSVSKLNTFSDGLRVLRTIFMLFKDYKPLTFFAIISLVLLFAGISAGVPIILEYVKFHYVYRVPTAILAIGLVLLSGLGFICGVILDTVTKQYRCMYEINLNNYSENRKSGTK